MHHQWNESKRTADYVPRTMVTTLRDDPFAPKLAGPNKLSYAPRLTGFSVTSNEDKYLKQKIPSPYVRLHVTSTHNTSPSRIRNGGLIRPTHNSTRPVSSDSFFRPNKFDGPTVKPRRMEFSHEYRVVRNPEDDNQLAMKGSFGGESRPTSPLRIVRHEAKGNTLPRRNPEVAAKGVSRNVTGGFYAK
mmetsp:Transcript_22894/g.26916  ORF Transcript_22894/g.26916 Transcript_22894/m.26916 type:complete len:188 (+) Transcript_22894:124-687(+)